jgi:hypothetical protein
MMVITIILLLFADGRYVYSYFFFHCQAGPRLKPMCGVGSVSGQAGGGGHVRSGSYLKYILHVGTHSVDHHTLVVVTCKKRLLKCVCVSSQIYVQKCT